MLKLIVYSFRKYYHLYIPFLSIIFWSSYVLVHEGFFLESLFNLRYDFRPYYYAGKQILSNPSKLYEVEGYVYLPSFAILYSILFSWQPIYIVWYTHYAFNIVLAFLCVIYYDKILLELNLKRKKARLILNTFIVFGWVIYFIFYFNQAKFIVVICFFIVLKRELKYKNDNKKKDIKYYLINFALLSFSLSITPYFIFFVLLYIFYDIEFKKIFQKSFIIKFGLFLLVFLIENFMFFIYPEIIFDYLKKGLTKIPQNWCQLIILREFPLSPSVINIIKILSIIIFFISIIILLNFREKLSLEKMFGYLSFIFLYFNIWKGYDTLVLIIPFILLLFLPYLKSNDFQDPYLKKIRIISFISILILELEPSYNSVIFNAFPFMKNYPLVIFVYIRWLIPISILTISYILLEIIKAKRVKNNFKENIKKIF